MLLSQPWACPGSILQPHERRITGTIAQGAANRTLYVTVQAASGSNVATEVFTWNITSPITISAIADQTKSENSPIGNLTVSATDSNSNGTPTLTYSATGLPPGLQMSTSSSGNTTSGVISGSIALGCGQQPLFRHCRCRGRHLCLNPVLHLDDHLSGDTPHSC